MIVAINENGKSIFIIDLWILRGIISAVRPNTNNKFAILLPIIFPNAIPSVCFTAEKRVRINSGMEVPNATTVSPIIKEEMPNLLAREEDPCINQSAPFTKRAIPIISRIISNIISFINYGFIQVTS